MRSRLTTITAGILIALLAAGALAAGLGAQHSSADGVTVTVTPQNISREAKSWEFKIVLETHSTDLSDDLTKSAALIDERVIRYVPTGWEGAGPGGHHRTGVLRFKPISPQPQAMELRITRTGEAVPRSFKWQLK